METQRLTSLVHPAHVQQLLDSYVVALGNLPAHAQKRTCWEDLPREWRHFAAQATADGYACTVWTDGERDWLFAGGLALDRAREFGRPVLEVHGFDSARNLRVSVHAERLPDGSWCHCLD